MHTFSRHCIYASSSLVKDNVMAAVILACVKPAGSVRVVILH